MQTIQAHFQQLGRDPTDAELETIAQTWSEHCSHKTLAGRVRYRDENGEREYQNMLKETIFAATRQIRRKLGEQGLVRQRVPRQCRHRAVRRAVQRGVQGRNAQSSLGPRALRRREHRAGRRDPRPARAPAWAPSRSATPTSSASPRPIRRPIQLPPGVLHPKRVMKGVVSGVRDYGNRMGIPTVNGAVYFDPRYLGNPLVYCGNVGIACRATNRSKKRRPATTSWPSAGARAATAFTAPRSARPN